MIEVKGRAAVVVGSAGGIGLAIAEALAEAGVRGLLLADLQLELAQANAERLSQSTGADVRAIKVDVTDQSSVEAVAEAAVRAFGGLHIAVSSAGVAPNGQTTWEASLDEWDRVLRVQLWGPIHGVRAFIPRIISTGEGGHLVNVGSMASVLPLAGVGPYGAAKHGVLALGDTLAAELAALTPSIGVSTVFPGMIRTPMNPIGTVEPSTVAANVLDAIQRDRRYVYSDDHYVNEVRSRLLALINARDEVLTPS
ncbi:SDR family NAD(P)-dependent oxidoreductase [Microbacterium sp. X-17]|uniref:SDR family NAD(P)-dependent oxidoreductase n=1 Tax=Microbacterium sp. X-17 TaxID=3144404 RepID=UPI0031F5627A